MKRRLSLIILILAMSLFAFPLVSACTEGHIVYTLSEDGTYYIISASSENLSESAFDEILPYYSDEIDPETGEMTNLKPVKSISVMGFMGCRKLKSIVVPDFITKIGISAFAYCTNLQSIQLSENLEAIPYGIFGGCTALRSVEIPSSVKRIEDYAFYMSSITEIVIPETVTSMGESVFYRCDRLEKAAIYADIDILPYGTFCSCQRLREVILPESIKEIKGYELLNGNKEVISEDDIIYDEYGVEVDTEDPNYTNNVVEKVPAFYFTYIEAGSNDITFDYELETLRYLGTEKELNDIVVGEYNVCLTESTILTVYCWENNEWKPVVWNF